MAKPTFSPVRTRRMFEETVRQIAEAIRLGDLRVGDRLPSERALAAQLEISRPTLREAAKILTDAGLIEVKRGPNGGMFVRSELVPRELMEHSQLRLSEIPGVLEARRLLEPRVAQLAGLYGTDEDFVELRKIIDSQWRTGGDYDRALQLEVQFHLAIARATKNNTIVRLMRSLHQELEITRDMGLRSASAPDWLIQVHEETLAALMSRDPERIEVDMDQHLDILEKVWEAETGRALLRRIPDFLLPYRQRRDIPRATASPPSMVETRMAGDPAGE
jgi:GntR family transcriptional repressor for pyruvate dehydrogenase complex